MLPPSSAWVGSYFLQNHSNICIGLLKRSLEEELRPCFILELFAFSLFLYSFTSPTSNYLSLLFGIQGKPRMPKTFSYKEETVNTEGLFVPRRTPQGPAQFQSHFKGTYWNGNNLWPLWQSTHSLPFGHQLFTFFSCKVLLTQDLKSLFLIMPLSLKLRLVIHI